LPVDWIASATNVTWTVFEAAPAFVRITSVEKAPASTATGSVGPCALERITGGTNEPSEFAWSLTTPYA